MVFDKKIYLAGQLADSADRITVTNPANESQVGQVAAADCAQVELALAAARDAFPGWRATPIAQRQRWMHRLRDAVIAHEEELRDYIHQEMGKPWAGTLEDFQSLVNSLQYYAEEITRIRATELPDRAGTYQHRLVYEPVGVAVAFLAWNFPLLNLAFKLGPAMAAGCPIIIRPSKATPISAYAVGELCHEIGLPSGVVQILATKSYEAADALSSSPVPALLTLIGSTATGRHIMCTGASTIKRYSMELGGNAPALVFADADLDHAADVICALKFNNAGQVCVTPNRVFVEASILQEFAGKVADRAKATAVGFDKAKAIVTGPLIDGRAWQRVKGLIDQAVKSGASLLAGGDRPAGLDQGHFLAPTVLGHVTSDMDIYGEEIFGPVVSLITFEDHETLLERANEGDDGGLTAYLFTADLARASWYAEHLRYGEVQINGVKYDIDLPHGGMGQSGIGHDCSYLALYDYLTIKRITSAIGGASAS
ncbi:MAG: aldehyde dehydrogenase family protein [Pseudomonadota bacterium]